MARGGAAVEASGMTTSTARRTLTMLVATAACAVAAGCGASDLTATSSSARAAAAPSPDLTSRVLQENEFLGLRRKTPAGYRGQTDPAAFVADNDGLYADPDAAIAALRRDGFVAGTRREFKSRHADTVVGISTVVQMRDLDGAAREVKRQFDGAPTPCFEDAQCIAGTQRFDAPGIPHALAIDVTRVHEHGRVHGVTINFSKGVFVYQVFAIGPRMKARRDELIRAADALYERVR
jgi:hypothetical protein